MNLADRIREVMREMGIRPAQFADAMGVKPASVTFWLDGKTRSLKAHTAARMEKISGFRANWIVTGKGPKKVADRSSPQDEEGPLSEDIWKKVLTLSNEELKHFESVARAQLRIPQRSVVDVTNLKQIPHGPKHDAGYPAEQEAGFGVPLDMAAPGPTKDGSGSKDRGRSRKKGRGGAAGHAEKKP